MPIRINLLAEAQVTAELRRKDPVKRGIWIGSFLVFVVVLWIAKLQLDIHFEESDAANVTKEWNSKMDKYKAVTNNQIRIHDIDVKLTALDTLSTNRFLWAPVFNALQKVVVDQVQVTRVSGTQVLTHEDDKLFNHVLTPGFTSEKIGLSIEAKDWRSGDQNYARFKEALGSSEFFTQRLGRRDGFVMDGILGPLTVDPIDPNKQFVTFTLASHFPEARRQ